MGEDDAKTGKHQDIPSFPAFSEAKRTYIQYLFTYIYIMSAACRCVNTCAFKLLLQTETVI